MAMAQSPRSFVLYTVLYVRPRTYTYDDKTMDEALLNESFDVARWLRAQTPPCPLSHPNTSDEAVELDKLGLVEIWDWLAQVRDELSNETLRQKQQGEINEPPYVQTKIRLEDLATRFTMAKRKRNWDRLIRLTKWFPSAPIGAEMAHPRRAPQTCIHRLSYHSPNAVRMTGWPKCL